MLGHPVCGAVRIQVPLTHEFRSHLVHVRMPRAGAHGTRRLGQMGRNFVKLGIRIRGALWRRRRAESICCEGVMRLSLID